jgi:hypothetical protein
VRRRAGRMNKGKRGILTYNSTTTDCPSSTKFVGRVACCKGANCLADVVQGYNSAWSEICGLVHWNHYPNKADMFDIPVSEALIPVGPSM